MRDKPHERLSLKLMSFHTPLAPPQLDDDASRGLFLIAISDMTKDLAPCLTRKKMTALDEFAPKGLNAGQHQINGSFIFASKKAFLGDGAAYHFLFLKGFSKESKGIFRGVHREVVDNCRRLLTIAALRGPSWEMKYGAWKNMTWELRMNDEA